MLETLRRSIGFHVARFHFRKSYESVQSFAQSISAAHQILLILPLDGSPLYPVASVITMLKRQTPEENITVAAAEHSAEALEALPRSPVVRILQEEITPFFLPRRAVVERICRKKYDVAIDLNLDFLIPSGYICKESNARIRVGFVRERSDLFYNFQFKTNATQSKTLQYERLAKCLQMF